MPRRTPQRWLAAVSLSAVVGCSVYDSSLIEHGDRLSDPQGGQSDTEAGDGGTASAAPIGGSSAGARAGSGGASGGSTAAQAGTAAGGGGSSATGGGGATVGGAAGSGGTSSGGNAGGGGTGGSAAGTAGSGGAPALVQLAVGKSATASTQQTGHEAAKGNDKDLASRWCASGGMYPQWWRVDLGAVHSVSQVAIRFEHADRTYAYVIETSTDDKVYTQQRTASGTSALQTLDLPADVTARYVRITVTSGIPVSVNGNGTWASFFDFTVLDT